ncbi:hypothetical protein F5Y19DRAFT_386497 [Xylariaceae sp. FL1651]|nr:hypothetical protein F5Y19DRAFT_386497 [Xylariaceae sp. FL1651]
MAQDALCIGNCHCETGRKRHHIPPSVHIPWESAPTVPLPLHIQANPGPDLDSDSDSEVDDDVDDEINDNAMLQNDTTHGDADPAILPNNPLLLLLSQAFNDTDDNDALPAGTVHFNINVAPEALQGLIEESSQDLSDSASDAGGSDPPGSDDDENDGFSEEGVPRIAPYRLNLTALSQHYNIYAVAYRNKIHLSRVRSCVENALPAHPDIVLKPPASDSSLRVGGYLDRNFPHQVNHLIMGDLGDAEILLLAYDDGDVIAYYTSSIEKELLRLESGNPLSITTAIRPFFHQNVEISAWGLAVHKQSRLIAVGTNKHNVHVFVFGLTNSRSHHDEADAEISCRSDLFITLTKDSEGRVRKKSVAGEELEQSENLLGNIILESGKLPLCQHRGRNYRIILETGDQGGNIPNLAFGSDDEGEALEILAVDILGNLWVMDISSLGGRPHLRVESLHKTYYRSMLSRNPRRRVPVDSLPKGWGVLVLPESSFMPTSTFKDSLGLSPEEAVYVHHNDYGYYIGTKKAIQHVSNNSTEHPWLRSHQLHRFGEMPLWHRVEEYHDWYNAKIDCKPDWSDSQDLAADQFTRQHPRTLRKRSNPDSKPSVLLADGSSVMRTYELDIELCGGDLDNIGIMLDNAIFQKRPKRSLIPHMHFSPERLANLLHVPELSLVVAGSLCGRVALITLTRPTNPHYSFKRGFKVEAILPTQQDEDRCLRPICPLLGVAIGPIPSAGKDERLLGERRYRIMIHYYDLRILSYEVYRDITTNELSVVWA